MEIKTYGHLKEHLLAVMDYADDEKKCKLNNAISKGKYWNMLMDCCIKEIDTKDVSDIVIKNTLTEFPLYTRCDYVQNNDHEAPSFDDEDNEDDLPF